MAAHPAPDPAVPSTGGMPSALPKQQLGSSNSATDTAERNECLLNHCAYEELSSSLSPPAESEDASYVLVLEQRPSKHSHCSDCFMPWVTMTWPNACALQQILIRPMLSITSMSYRGVSPPCPCEKSVTALFPMTSVPSLFIE